MMDRQSIIRNPDPANMDPDLWQSGYDHGNMTMARRTIVKSKRQRIIGAGEFKTKCLQLMDEVNMHKIEVVITKRGQPVAKLVPANEPVVEDIFGSMRGTVTIHGDIVSPEPGSWGELA